MEDVISTFKKQTKRLLRKKKPAFWVIKNRPPLFLKKQPFGVGTTVLGGYRQKWNLEYTIYLIHMCPPYFAHSSSILFCVDDMEIVV